MMRHTVRNLLLDGAARVAVPAWFDWTPLFNVRKVGSIYVPSITPGALLPPTSVTMYVSSTGSNANNGSTIALAKRSIANAYNAGATTIIGADTSGVVDYTRTNGFEGLTLANRHLIITSLGATMIIGRFEPPSALTWVQDGTYSNVYTCTRSTTVTARDRAEVDADGNLYLHVSRASIADVAANPGSINISGSSVSVSRLNGQAPGSDILLFLSGNNGLINATMAGKTLWVDEHVEFWGGDAALATSGLSVADGTRIVASGVKAKYATNASTGNGFSLSNLAEAYLFNCNAEANNLDGFNYHYAGGGKGFALEETCIGRNNGVSAGSHQGSSAHEEARIVRMNGLYIGNAAEQVKEIDTAQSWNLGCRASGGDHNWESAGSAIMTLDDCTSDGSSLGDIDVVAPSTMYLRNFVGDSVISGTPTYY